MDENVLRIRFDELDDDPEQIWDIFPLYWQGKLFTGVAYETFPNGQLSSETEMRDGYHDGFYREWYPSGQLKVEHYSKRIRNYGDVKPEEQYGWTKEWFENGILKRDMVTHIHRRIKEKIWNENGELISSYEQPEQLNNQSAHVESLYGKFAAPGVEWEEDELDSFLHEAGTEWQQDNDELTE